MTRRSTLVDRLRALGCVSAEAEADELLADRPDDATLAARLDRRSRGEPLEWIVGRFDFGGRRYVIDEGVYVPRPHTELLAERAARLLGVAGRMVDLCCGAGAVAAHVAAELPSALVLGVDVDPVAVRCARANGVRAVVGDLGSPLVSDRFDVVTAVAPYVPTAAITLLPADVQRHEPRQALDGGADGLVVVRRVVADAARLLRPGGRLLIELGGDLADPIGVDLARRGFRDPEPWSDLHGDLRGIEARLLGSTI